MIPSKEELLPFKENRRDAAKFFDVSEKTIINWFKKYELYEPKKNYGCGKLNRQKAEEIRNLYTQGISMGELATKYQVTFATISRIIHNLIYREGKDTAIVSVVYNLETTGKAVHTKIKNKNKEKS